MAESSLKIATRKSPLALWQAEHVAERLQLAHPGLRVELVGMSTRGDRVLDSPLAKIGGKGLFVKELELALLDGRADIAVHSMKDVPMDFPDGLHLPVIMERESPLDAFVSNRFKHPDQLPEGAIVGSSSLRRQCQLMARYPQLQVRTLRGNVNTRLAKLDAGEYDAIILAVSGLRRLGFDARIAAELTPDVSLPAIGQGALGIESRAGDTRVEALIRVLDDTRTHRRVAAERAFNHRLKGGCQVPIAGYALLEGEEIWLRGLVGKPDGTQIIADERRGHWQSGEGMGRELADSLLASGAARILRALYDVDTT